MELIGRIQRRKIYYVEIRNNSDWKKSLPKKNWIAFTIANQEDEELVPPMVTVCLNKKVSFTCSAGDYAEMTEFFFDEEISWRAFDTEMQTEIDYVPITSAHDNFEDGFLFATTVAGIDKSNLEKVVCIDLTKKKVKNQLINFIEKINSVS